VEEQIGGAGTGQDPPVTVVEWVRELGGVATRGTLLRLVSRPELDRAVAAGDVVRIARGRYALTETDRALLAATALGGVLSMSSAALQHGWAVKTVPDLPHVTVAKSRKIAPQRRRGVHLHRANLDLAQRAAGVTDVETTLRDCLRLLPFDEALAIADSALRGGVGAALLQGVADLAAGPGAPQVRRVAGEASPLAANPFESALRAISLDVPGLALRPQVWIRDCAVRPDLDDERLRNVVEADSFEWHGKRSALARDARRYNSLVAAGWLVLRFAWEDVMHDPDHVRRVLADVTGLAERRTEAPSRGSRAA
jgi:very-short-patch-repair endonuclease